MNNEESSPLCAYCARQRFLNELQDSPLWKRLRGLDDEGRTELDDELDDPRRGQAAALNRLR